LPFTKWFNNAHLFLNQNYYLFGACDYWQELFLTNTTKLYYIGRCHKKTLQNETTNIELDFTFNRTTDANNFLNINCIPVVNVEKEEITVDERNPVKDLSPDIGEFLNLLYDEENQHGYKNILIRQFNVERFNSYQLFEQMQEMLYRYHSDYYAFQTHRELKTGDILNNLQLIMEDMSHVVDKLDKKMHKDHYYAILTKSNQNVKKVDLQYLTTNGASSNGIRKNEKALKTPVALENSKTVLLLETKGGRDVVKNEAQKDDIAKYYHHTKDRLVTPVDIAMFIKTFYFENVRLGDEIENISIQHDDNHITVTVNLKDNSELKASDKREILSEMLQNKISLRTSGILPFHVKIL
jgi:hypothetical protein